MTTQQHPNEKRLAALTPQRAGARPRLISDDGIAFVVATALPQKLTRVESETPLTLR